MIDLNVEGIEYDPDIYSQLNSPVPIDVAKYLMNNVSKHVYKSTVSMEFIESQVKDVITKEYVNSDTLKSSNQIEYYGVTDFAWKIVVDIILRTINTN